MPFFSRKKSVFSYVFMFSFALFFSQVVAVKAILPEARSAEVDGDVFLGGEYIELGISRYGSFGTSKNKPEGFFGTAVRQNIGMSADFDGFDTGLDLRMDFFMPGTQEERWSVGYMQEGTPITASNASQVGTIGIADNLVVNQSSDDTLSALSAGTLNETLEIKQLVSFQKSSKFFKNEVTLTNMSESQTIDSVRYMRSFDPDNTKDQNGDYKTQNTIVHTHEAGDEVAVVMADTSWTDTDPVYLATGGSEGGTRSPILFYSSDSRAKVSYHTGLQPGTVYSAGVYASVQEKGSTETRDGAIAIAFDVGSLAPGESETIVYYTSLDDRDFSEVVADIQSDEGGIVPEENVSVSVTQDSAEIVWTTEVETSTQVEYGFTTSYGFTTEKQNEDTKVTDHAVTLTDLQPCVRYFYRVVSQDEEGNVFASEPKYLVTAGCDISHIETGSQKNIAQSGGELTFTQEDISAQIIVPDGFYTTQAYFQINKLATTNTTAPKKMSLAEGNLFDFSALDLTGNKITHFDAPITLNIEYSEAVEQNFLESSLAVFTFSDGGWVKKDCILDVVLNSITCELHTFSTYALFGEQNSAQHLPSQKDSQNQARSINSHCSELPIVGTSHIFQIDRTSTSARVYFMPIGGITEFYISYSTQPFAEEHGVQISAGELGVQNFLIHDLLPNVPYFFKIRAQKGCQNGEWSEVAVGKIETRKKSSKSLVVEQSEKQNQQNINTENATISAGVQLEDSQQQDDSTESESNSQTKAPESQSEIAPDIGDAQISEQISNETGQSSENLSWWQKFLAFFH